MKRFHVRGMACTLALLGALGGAGPAEAQIGVGTWVRQTNSATPGVLTMTVEACCNGGRRLIYKFGNSGQTMLVESAFDGKEVQVLLDGKPSGETMAITKVDSSHTSTIVKMNGKPFGISKSTLSADGKTLTVENEYSASVGGNAARKQTETWVRK